MKYSICIIMIEILFVSTLACAADTNPIHYRIEPESIMRSIQSRGAGAIVEELNNDQNLWQSVLKKIASSDESWLRTAVALRPGTDAGTSESLDLAVGEALEHNPANVFKIALKVFLIRNICGTIEYDSPHFNTYEHAMNTINLRIHKVASMKERALESTGLECIQYLETSKEGIEQFFRDNK